MATAVPCPHCGKRYQMQAEWAGKKLKCRACGQSFRVPAPAENAPAALGPQDLADELLPRGAGLPLDSIPPLASVDPFAVPGPTILTPVGSWHKRRAWLRRLKIGGLVVGVLAVAAGLIVGGVFLVKAAWESASSLKSLRGEEWILGEIAIDNELAQILRTMKDRASSEAARPRLAALKARDSDLQKKFDALRLTAEEKRELDWKHGAEARAAHDRFEREAERAKLIPEARIAFAQAWSGELGAQPMPGTMPASQPSPAMGPNVPGSLPGEDVLLEAIQVLNEGADILATITDEPSARAAIAKVQAMKSRLEELARRVRTIRATPEENRQLDEKYLARIRAARTRVQDQFVRLQTLSTVPQAIWRDAIPQFNPPGPPAMPGMTPFSGPNSAPPEDEVQKLTRECGADKILTVTVEGVPDAQSSFVYAKIREASGARGVARTSAGTVTVTVGPTGDVQAAARRIDFGQVTHVDPAGRKIAVKADPAKFPEPIKPEATNPAHADYVKANLAELKCPDPDRRSQAASRLRRAGVKESREEVAKALLALMADNDPATRREAMGAWAACQTQATIEEAIATLVKLAADQDALVRAAAWDALAAIKDKRAVTAVAEMLSDEAARKEAANCLRKMGPAAEKAVIAVAAGGEKGALAEAMHVLDKIGTAECIPVVIRTAGSGDAEASRAAFRILQRIKDEQSIGPMIELLASTSHRFGAANVLKAIGEQAEDAVLKGLKSRDPQVVLACLDVLAEIATKKSLGPIKSVRSRDRWVLDSARRTYATIAARNGANRGGFDTDGGTAPADGKSSASGEPGTGAKDPLMKGGFDAGPAEKGGKSGSTVVE